MPMAKRAAVAPQLAAACKVKRPRAANMCALNSCSGDIDIRSQSYAEIKATLKKGGKLN